LIGVTAPSPLAQADPLAILHSFAGPPTDGDGPEGLVLDGSTLYGSTWSGAPALGLGTVFTIGADGNNYNTLYSFLDGYLGMNPVGGITISGSSLYGVTWGGGNDLAGSIFKIGLNGAGFDSLTSFGAADFGDQNPVPQGGLTVAGSMVYGTTSMGGANDCGTIYEFGTNGTGLSILHSFSGTDGVAATGGLVLLGSTLYGTTEGGVDSSGTYHDGTLFKINTNGTGFSVLHTFGDNSFNSTDGAAPNGNLLLVGSTLYGTTYGGGDAGGWGTIFKIGIDGTGYSILRSFTGANSGSVDGIDPCAGLCVVGSTLYGATASGGSSHGIDDENGTLFKINTDGSGYSILYSFTGGADGYGPGITSTDGSKLYGGACGGAYGDGTLFSFTPPQPGDANGGGRVDINDLTIVLTNFGRTSVSWSQGDFAGDGTIDMNDLTIVLSNFDKTPGAALGAVPEPPARVLLALALLAPLVYACRASRSRLPGGTLGGKG
jgi:uncharacterized repeat protein (TIGR03803 family)